MSILNYFKPKESLPDPNGPVSQNLSSRAIAAANSEVANVSGSAAMANTTSDHESAKIVF